MPTYDYLCNECGCEFEQAHGFHDEPSPCESCGSPDIKKVINQAPMGFVKEWWQKSGDATKKDISKMSDKQKSDYIFKGKK